MHWTKRIGRRLKPRDLHIFLIVVEQGNMAKAADVLAISRPVISKAIAELEEALGVRLLDRHPRGIEPTLFGRALIKRGVAVFDELRQSVEEIEFLADPSTGELRIGCTEPVAAGILQPIIGRLSGQYPQMTFHVELGDAITLQTRTLRERSCDVVIARMRAPSPEADMEAEFLFHERLHVAAGPNNRWAGRRKIALSELVDEPWMLAPLEIADGSPVVEAFRAQGLTIPRATVLGYSLPLRTGLLATGQFLTVVPGSVLRFGAERTLLKALPIELPNWKLPVAIITLKNRTLSPVAQLFIKTARAVAKPLANAA